MRALISRQPIFTRDARVAGYRVLCRLDETEGQPARERPDDCPPESSERALVDALLGVGLDRLAEGRPAHLPFSRGLLLADAAALLDGARVVLQLPDRVGVDDPVVARCAKLSDSGYTLSLDAGERVEVHEPILPFIDIARIDVCDRSPDTLERIARGYQRFDMRLLATNVADTETRDYCVAFGFDLFEGVLFSQPADIDRPDLSVEYVRTLRLMNLVRDMAVSEHAIGSAFRSDPPLSYKLLRMVNSCANGGRDLQSIEHAIGLLGRDQIYRWLALLLVMPGTSGSLDQEIAIATVARAQFCAMVGSTCVPPWHDGLLFMTGLLSGLDSFYRLPIGEIIDQLGLTSEVDSALRDGSGRLGDLLRLIACFEAGDWNGVNESAAALQIRTVGLTSAYLESLEWAHDRVRSFGTKLTV